MAKYADNDCRNNSKRIGPFYSTHARWLYVVPNKPNRKARRAAAHYAFEAEAETAPEAPPPAVAEVK